MHDNLLIGFGGIVLLGIAAQWLAWRIRVPSILILLVFGFAAGPVTGFLKPDEMFGDLLSPFVSISVAVILYEGGLNLSVSEMRAVGHVVRNLITIGLVVTWIASAAGAHIILGLSLPLSILLGAILVVTGPTVILPILRSVRPAGQLNSVLKWEGILNDPVGALLAILVFEGILAVGIEEATIRAITGLLITIFLGGGIGVLGAYLMVLLLKRRLIPDFLHNAFSVMVVVTVFTISNLIQPESGLFTVTVMGIFLANQKSVVVHHIIEFKEHLTVLLISALFIILAARLRISDMGMLGMNSFVFLGLLILIIRPLAVLSSTIRSGLSWRERLYISWMAPRGIVAAAVVSLFALELSRSGYPQAERLVPLTFLVIVGTIAVYGLSAMPLAKWLGIADPHPQGSLIIGAHPFARAIAGALEAQGFNVLLTDTNRTHVNAARLEGLPVYHGSVLSEDILDDIDLTGIGRLLAMTPNQEVNTLAGLYFEKTFGKDQVYHLATEADEQDRAKSVTQALQGDLLFGSSVTYSLLEQLFRDGAQVKVTPITEEFDYDAFKSQYRDRPILPMFLIGDDDKLTVFTSEYQPTPQPGQKVVSFLMGPESSRTHP
jgi:NhaP-type Na+/H+ or K+/H+ antiporter